MFLLDVFRNWSNTRRNARMTRMLNGGLPIFSQFGSDIYASDMVQNCINVIATEMSKLQPRHIRSTDDQEIMPKGNINRLLKFGPNPLMTTSEFIEKIIWTLMMNYNAFVIPVFDVDYSNGIERRTYRALYPVNPSRVEFLQDPEGMLLIRLYFASGVDFTFPYQDVIHLRKKFSVNEFMGGGANGQPDNAALLKVLQTNHTLAQGLERAAKINAAVQAVLKVATLMDDDAAKAERARFERLIADGESGILPVDLKGEFIPIKGDAKFIEKDTLAFLKQSVLDWFGVSMPILTGEFNDDEYQAFYEKTLEPLVVYFGQKFSKILFSERELDVGNEIIWYHRDMNYLSTTAKLNLIKTAGEQGLLSDNQKLRLLGYPPVPGGERRTQSLNYIDINLVNQYQMTNLMNKGKAVEDNEQGNSS
ncbi:phage portal protein [Paenibacillus taichungensis]|uniref:phage portal protein n=1 Tax=Paenibacillus taichungensis TaxID=484184 RepID=UPI002DBE33B4|nr:phage portal protein [Paenibacillus taichungensis]MEC0107261.1 phage portal protein [Paenibacillus taichungensis]MEC0194807.1 phage portal protein [Paenibacillus taichungensis]